MFNGISNELWTLANKEALQYVLDHYDRQVLPIITTAFWSEGERLTAAEPWNQVMEHGAHLIKFQLSSIETVIIGWQVNYELTPAQVDLMRKLFDLKIATPGHTIFLSKQELAILKSRGDKGLKECRELLAAIGIVIPVD
jgi:hypothetical protein